MGKPPKCTKLQRFLSIIQKGSPDYQKGNGRTEPITISPSVAHKGRINMIFRWGQVSIIVPSLLRPKLKGAKKRKHDDEGAKTRWLRSDNMMATKRKHDSERAIKPSICHHRVIAPSPSCFRSFV